MTSRFGRRTERGSAIHKLSVALVGVVMGTAVGTSLGWLPHLSDGPSGRRAGVPASGAGVALPVAPAPRPSLADDSSGGGRLDPRALRLLLADAVADRSLGSHVEVVIEPLGTAKPVLRLGDAGPVTPASLLKLLTLTAALEVLGPDQRFTTSVVQGRRRSDLVLVGGGDPLLATRLPSSTTDRRYPYPPPASLTTLARRTAKQLAAAGIARVHLAYDASRFTRPAVSPAWRASYVSYDVVSPVSALEVDEGRARPGFARRVLDPAATAAQRFANLLEKRGVNVAAPVAEGRGRQAETTVAAVRSPPVAAIVQHIVELSDNDAAEVMLRQLALATGRSGSFRSGVRATEEVLAGLGVDLSGVTFFDGSGLARSNAVPIRVLTDVLQLAADPQHPELRAIVSSLPVAGFTGSLAYRFTGRAQVGLGKVRAKTGTLTGVHGLAGLVVTRDGQTLVFAAVADSVPVRRTLAARAQLDRIAALLTTCGCTGD